MPSKRTLLLAKAVQEWVDSKRLFQRMYPRETNTQVVFDVVHACTYGHATNHYVHVQVMRYIRDNKILVDDLHSTYLYDHVVWVLIQYYVLKELRLDHQLAYDVTAINWLYANEVCEDAIGIIWSMMY